MNIPNSNSRIARQSIVVGLRSPQSGSVNRLNGKPPKLSKRQHLKVLAEYEAGEVTVGDLAEDYAVNRATIYRTIARAKTMREGSP